jgi:hypothetical protein
LGGFGIGFCMVNGAGVRLFRSDLLGYLVSCLSLLRLFFFGEFTAGAAGGILLSLFLSFLVSFGFLGEQDWRYAKLA